MTSVLYGSEEAAAAAWGAQNRPLSEVRERMAFIYAMPADRGSGYYLGRTGTGMGRWGPLRPNVALPFVGLYLFETLTQRLLRRAKPTAWVHSHPRPPQGASYRQPSREDRLLLKLPGIHAVYVVPYETDQVTVCRV